MMLDILFRLTLFILLASLIIRFLYSYGLPMLYGGMQSLQTYVRELKEKRQELAQTEKTLTHALEEQAQTIINIEQKLAQWHALSDVEYEQKKLSYEHTLEKIRQKRIFQSQELHALQLQNEALPRAIKEAFIEIQSVSAGVRGQSLLTELIDDLEKKSKQSTASSQESGS